MESGTGRRVDHRCQIRRETEREILDAAERLLRERPFREISVDAVMSQTGLKRPAFYVHFRDRHDLALRVVENAGRTLFEMTDRWLRGEDPAADARRAFEGLVEVYVEHGSVLRALADAAASDEKVERAYNALVQRFIDATVRHIRDEQARGRIGELADVEQTARALIWMDERYLSEALGREPHADPQVVADVLYNIWMSTLYSADPAVASHRSAASLPAAGQ
ncbi:MULTISPECIES: TetR/AcrR family transcriptional regulator [unclassified Streptomyces]|uniref:TetR/AcrR family transcriptional regulator n=1 Tax=unclassified Streptomyces TaxID=2593676 RepID=UPI001E2C4BE6|nr:TetR/AcrR family transcriptional regulator [Streptomyces sp. CB02980]MCB8901481.1 TetR/AcrR family transcriptional regulator [Streptomyces sp. CB02980]